MIRSRSAFECFLFGLTLPARSARLIFLHFSLLAWSLVPIVISIVIAVWLASSVQAAAQEAMLQLFATWGWDPSGTGVGVLLVLAQILIFLMGAMLISFIAVLVSVPINDFLAEATERHTVPMLEAVASPSLRDRVRMIRIDLGKTLTAALLSLVAFSVSWIPVLNLLAVVLTFYLMAFQFLSYPQTRRGQTAKAGFEYLKAHPYSCLGFGMVTAFLFSVPFLAFLVIPVSVVGGTLLYAASPETNAAYGRIEG